MVIQYKHLNSFILNLKIAIFYININKIHIIGSNSQNSIFNSKY